jgi:hypothetical protein
MTGRAALPHAAVRARRPEGPAGEPASRPTGMQEVEAWCAQGGRSNPGSPTLTRSQAVLARMVRIYTTL